jgi:hypothetical protein
MILRMLTLVLALGSGLTSPLFAGAERGDRLFIEAGGIPGAAGVAGIPGATISGFVFADFYALMPTDNAAPVAPGAAVLFPENGPTSGIITRINSSTFLLPEAGTYLVEFQVSVTQGGPNAAQLELSLNGVADAISVVGRATGTDQLVGTTYVTVGANTTLQVINPANNTVSLTITPDAGGTNPVSAHLLIMLL